MPQGQDRWVPTPSDHRARCHARCSRDCGDQTATTDLYGTPQIARSIPPVRIECCDTGPVKGGRDLMIAEMRRQVVDLRSAPLFIPTVEMARTRATSKAERGVVR